MTRELTSKAQRFVDLVATNGDVYCYDAFVAAGFSQGSGWRANAYNLAHGRYREEILGTRARLGIVEDRAPALDDAVAEQLRLVDGEIAAARERGDNSAVRMLLAQRAKLVRPGKKIGRPANTESQRQQAGSKYEAILAIVRAGRQPNPKAVKHVDKILSGRTMLEHFESSLPPVERQRYQTEITEEAVFIDFVRDGCPEGDRSRIAALSFRREVNRRLDAGTWSTEIEAHYRSHGHSDAIAQILAERGLSPHHE